jgi:hypothetical protein
MTIQSGLKMAGLKAKEVRDKAAGKGFLMQPSALSQRKYQ